MARPIEAVVFDMDGVLIDSEPIWRAVERETFARVGIQVTDEDLVKTMGVRIGDVVDLWFRRHPWEGPTPAELAESIVRGVARTIEGRGAVREGAVEAVDYFRRLGLPTALASSSSMPLIRAVLSLGGLAQRFDVVHSGEGEERGKPHPAVYLTVAAKLGVGPERCLAIEDSLNGVRSAKAAGMVCIAIPETAGQEGSFGQADLVVPSLADIGDGIWEATATRPAPRR